MVHREVRSSAGRRVPITGRKRGKNWQGSREEQSSRGMIPCIMPADEKLLLKEVMVGLVEGELFMSVDELFKGKT